MYAYAHQRWQRVRERLNVHLNAASWSANTGGLSTFICTSGKLGTLHNFGWVGLQYQWVNTSITLRDIPCKVDEMVRGRPDAKRFNAL